MKINEIILLNETLSKPFPFRWTKRASMLWEGFFFLPNNHKIELMCGVDHIYDDEDETKYWNILFKRTSTGSLGFDTSSYAATGDGDQFGVFSTIIAMLREFIETVKPEMLMFSSAKFTADAGFHPSRTRLYRSMCNRFAASVGYTFQVKDFEDTDMFVISRIPTPPSLFARIKSKLKETVLHEGRVEGIPFITHSGHEIELTLIYNPTLDQANNFTKMTNHKTCRLQVLDNKTAVMWDAFYVEHNDVLKLLGKNPNDYSRDTKMFIYFCDDRQTRISPKALHSSCDAIQRLIKNGLNAVDQDSKLMGTNII